MQAPACALLYERQNQRRSVLFAATTPDPSVIADDDAVLDEDEEVEAAAAAGAGGDERRPVVRSLAPVVQRALAQRYHQRMTAQHTRSAPDQDVDVPG
jgi:hypothetical protein